MKSNYIKITLLLFGCIIQLALFSQNWVQKTSLPAASTGVFPFEFSIGGKLYAGGGYNGTIFSSFFIYDPATNIWTPKANLLNNLYGGAFFVLNGMGYIVCGNSLSGLTNGVYMYNPQTDTWIQKNNFPGTPRQNTIGFSLNGHGYVFGGFAGGSVLLNDMWQYDAATDSWTQMASAPGPTRNGPTAIVIDNQAYVGLGNDVNGSVCYSDFYRFDPVSNSYSQMANSPIARSVPAHFVIGSLGYIGLGFIPHSPYVARDFTTFDPANGALGTWTAISNFTGVPRGWGFSDTVGGKPYVGAGSDFIGGIYYYDLWTWDSCSIIVNLGRDTTLCLGASITLADTFSNATSLWSTGDTSRSITVSSSGRYWLKVTQATCTGSDTINVSFVPPSNIDLGHDTAYCGTFSRVLATGINSTLWSNGYVAPSITVANPGLYWAQLTSLCGVIRDSITISDNPLPVVNLGNDTNLCSGSTVLLDATTANANYEWQDGSTNPTFMVRTAGTYSVVVTINGCGNRDSIAVGYINPPIFYIGGDTAYCGSFNRILTAGIPYTIWSNGDTALSIAIDSPGVYWGSIAGCNNILKDSIVIYENTIPHVNIGNDTILCAGDTLTLSALTLDANYLWQDGSVNATFVISAPGVYWVDVTVKGCTKSDSITIDQLRPPSISLANDTTICQDSTLALTVYAMFSQYHWSNGDTASSILVNQSGQYTVTVSNTCGSTIASENITLEQCNCTVRIPTAFSPNDDNRNDKFWVLTHCPLENFELDIYDRWGQKIFLSNSVTTKWDGTYKGAQQPLGVYVYVIRYTDPYTGADISQTGNVTLLR